VELISPFNKLLALHRTTPYPTLEERKNNLRLIKKALQNNAYVLAEAISQDFSYRAVEETLFLELFPIIRAIDYCLSHVHRWMKPRKRHVSWLLKPASASLSPQPLGVVGNMVPWNYPVYLALMPACYALAAGNRVMIKMSELSPHTGRALKKLIHSIGLDSWIVIVNGDVDCAKAFATLPFGHLLFTGSTRVGKEVMRAATEHLVPVTLELGGKSPGFISKTMNPRYFNRLFMGKLFNAAQTCVAPDYLLVPKGWASRVEQAFAAFLQQHYPDLMNNKSYSSIISVSHKQRLLALIEDASQKGARVVSFGEMNTECNKLPVTLIFDVTEDMRVMQEEIFGPILPIMTYTSLQQALTVIQSMPSPLALYYFGEDKAEQETIKMNTRSGCLTINDTLMHIAVDDLPFGGVGASGMGAYHGQEGFDTFSHLKPVMVQKRWSPVTWLYPPYGLFMKCVIRFVGGIKKKAR
jgi:coniferyl-aldehyde dehydrogenase